MLDLELKGYALFPEYYLRTRLLKENLEDVRTDIGMVPFTIHCYLQINFSHFQCKTFSLTCILFFSKCNSMCLSQLTSLSNNAFIHCIISWLFNQLPGDHTPHLLPLMVQWVLRCRHILSIHSWVVWHTSYSILSKHTAPYCSQHQYGVSICLSGHLPMEWWVL